MSLFQSREERLRVKKQKIREILDTLQAQIAANCESSIELGDKCKEAYTKGNRGVAMLLFKRKRTHEKICERTNDFYIYLQNHLANLDTITTISELQKCIGGINISEKKINKILDAVDNTSELTSGITDEFVIDTTDDESIFDEFVGSKSISSSKQKDLITKLLSAPSPPTTDPSKPTHTNGTKVY